MSIKKAIVAAYRAGWTEVPGERTFATLQAAGFPTKVTVVKELEFQFTRPWVMRLYVALPGTNPLLQRVGAAIRAGLDPAACEAADALGGVEAVVALAQGFRP